MPLSCNWSCQPLLVHWTLSIDGADAALIEFLVNMSASADVLAMAKVEVDLTAIPEGKNVSWNRLDIETASLTSAGCYQVARQARLHPTPNPG